MRPEPAGRPRASRPSFERQARPRSGRATSSFQVGFSLRPNAKHLGDGEAHVQRVVLGEEPEPGHHRPRSWSLGEPEHLEDADVGLANTHRELQQGRLAGAIWADERRYSSRRESRACIRVAPTSTRSAWRGRLWRSEAVLMPLSRARRADRVAEECRDRSRRRDPRSARDSQRCRETRSALRSHRAEPAPRRPNERPSPRRPSTMPSRSS